MFETMSHEALQEYWWILVSILGAFLVFLMFVQGGQTLIFQIGKSEEEKTLLLNALGRKWELTFTTIVTFGGAFFASFPLFYSTSFGGAYWVWMLILFGFILQAVSYEYRKKPSNVFGSKVFEIFLVLNGVLATVLIGAAVGTFFTGSEFSVNEYNLSRWENPARGLEAALNIENLTLGMAVFFLSRVLASLHFINAIRNVNIFSRAKKQLQVNSILFLGFFLLFVYFLLTQNGFAVDQKTGIVSMEQYKYLHNFIAMPIVSGLFLIGVVLVLFSLYKTLFKGSLRGIWPAGIGTMLVVFSLFLVAAFNNTAYYPSVYDLQSSLTIHNSSSSHYTLSAMSYVSLAIPFVLAYIWYAWNAINKKKLDLAELKEAEENGDHLY